MGSLTKENEKIFILCFCIAELIFFNNKAVVAKAPPHVSIPTWSMHLSFVVLAMLGLAFATHFGVHAHDKSQALRGSESVR